MHRILFLAAALLLPAGAAMAQGSAAKCASDPRFYGCYTSAASISRTNVLLLSVGDAVRNASVAQVLGSLLATDVTAALGYVPVSPTALAALSPVAASGAYSDLSGKPVIPIVPAVGTAAGTLAAGNDARITGAVQAAGGAMTGPLTLPYARVVAANAGAAAFTANVSELFLDPAAGIASFTVTLPATPVDGQTAEVSCGQAITTLTVNAAAGQAMRPSGTTAASACTAVQGHAWRWRAAQAAWNGLY